MKIEITNNGTINMVNIEDSNAEKAKDELLKRMFFARKNPTMGGYQTWIKLLDMYYSEEYDEMINKISSYFGYGGATRKKCIELLNIIKKEKN